MRRLNRDERARVAEKIMEWGNLGFASLVLGQVFVTEFSFLALSLGIFLYAAAYILAIAFMKGGKK